MQKSYRIIYFTGTGNTCYVANEIEKRLQTQSHEIKTLVVDELWAACGRNLHTAANPELIKQKLAEFLTGAQVLIVLYPVYLSTIPQPLRDLLPFFPVVSGMKLAVIAVCALTGGDCCYLVHQALQPLGYQSLVAVDLKMPSNMTFPYLTARRLKNGDELKDFYQTATAAIDEVMEKIITEQSWIKGRTFAARLLGIFQRGIEKCLGKWIARQMFATKDCIKCKRCVLSCPMANISFDDLPKFGNRCCLCMRCYNFCPQCAIQVTKKTLDTKVYVRYRGFNHWSPPQLYKEI